jgi:phosphatidylserine/phosphatidylglycerophosphate/cardiolipin synthase-like enzyme
MKSWNLVFPLFLVCLSANAAEGDASFAVSPESAYSLIQAAIQDAHQSIDLNIYMLTNRNITDALAAKAKGGVKVTILMEGQTFGNDMLAPVKKVLDDFEAKLQGTNARFLVMTSQANGQRRYAFDHAKYMVVDGHKIFVSSENLTGSAFNIRNQTGGTRGWEIYLENSALGAQLSGIFATDSDPSFGDVLPYEQVNFNVKDPGNSPLPPRENRDVPSFGMAQGQVTQASLCASPNSLPCVVDFIRSAKSELNLEFLSLPKVWVDHKRGTTTPSPVIAELIEAAKRGVHVRVLLNDDTTFADDTGGGSSPDEKNLAAVNYLRDQAGQAHLPLEAATFSQKKIEVNYVHNKGMVADGNRVFVSSINGTENAIMNNREIAVAVTSEDAGKYFTSVFKTDWELSTGN